MIIKTADSIECQLNENLVVRLENIKLHNDEDVHPDESIETSWFTANVSVKNKEWGLNEFTHCGVATNEDKGWYDDEVDFNATDNTLDTLDKYIQEHYQIFGEGGVFDMTIQEFITSLAYFAIFEEESTVDTEEFSSAK